MQRAALPAASWRLRPRLCSLQEARTMDDEDGPEAPPPIVCAIAKPLADSRLTKKVLKVVKKGV